MVVHFFLKLINLLLKFKLLIQRQFLLRLFPFATVLILTHQKISYLLPSSSLYAWNAGGWYNGLDLVDWQFVRIITGCTEAKQTIGGLFHHWLLLYGQTKIVL